MFWKRNLQVLQQIADEILENRESIIDLRKELHRVESKTEVMVVYEEGIIDARTTRLPTSDVVGLLLRYLGLKIAHTEESYKIEKGD